MQPVEQHVLAVAFEERLATLIEDRRWYRNAVPWARLLFAPDERDTNVELRALLRLRRHVRQAQRAAVYHASFAYDLGQAVMDEDRGMDREGLPEFNGAFG